MSQIVLKVILVLILIYSSTAYACFPAKVPIEKRVTQATQIAVGFVTGKILHEFEARFDNPGLSVQTSEAYTLRVKIIENIKGRFNKEIINPIISSCGSGNAELKQKVLVFFDGEYWFVKPFEGSFIKRVKEIISSVR